MTAERQLTLHAPNNLGLLVRRLEGTEGISRLFEYEVTLYAPTEDVDLTKLLGERMCIGLALPGGGERFFHGYVAACGLVGSEGKYTLYRASLRPHLWRLTQSVDCRIYQGETVPDIVESIFKEYGLSYDLASLHTGTRGGYLPWEYCVQYRESDFAFVSRLLEREGIHYWFEHEEGRELLVLADSNTAHMHVMDYEKVHYTRALNMQNRREESVWSWTTRIGVLPDSTSLTDYDFKNPGASLAAASPSDVQRAPAKAREPQAEVYDQLETFVQQQGYNPQLGEVYARIRSEELHTGYATHSANTDARGLCVGALFGLLDGPAFTQGAEFMVTGTHVIAEMDQRSSGSDAGQAVVFSCTFDAIDTKVTYRPARVTPKPLIPGPQSAIVTGPKGSKDHYTDEWGRVLVKFHWYRPAKDGRAENSQKEISCWVRVSQNSAGANWGSMFVPHIGQEVIVGFYEGDPDRPVVIGRLYNGANKPPLTLPDHAYKSIIRDHYGNEIIFDGTPGKEHMAFHTPASTSVMKIGRGKQEITHQDNVQVCANRTEATLGDKNEHVVGNGFMVKRGLDLAVSLGTKCSVFAGTSFNGTMASNFEFKGGTTFSLQASTTFSWGAGADFKRTKGGFTRASGGTALLDSDKEAIVSGGKDDVTMLISTDEEIALSFDPSAPSRVGQKKDADAKALRYATAFGGATAALSGVATWNYEHAKTIAANNKSGAGKLGDDINAALNEMEALIQGDWLTVAATVAGLAGGIAPAQIKVPPPKHNAPAAKVLLRREHVLLFHGTDQAAKIGLNEKKGVAIHGNPGIFLSSDKSISVRASNDIQLTADGALKIKADINHPNLKVRK